MILNEPGAPTLDQLNVLLAVVETGGFAAAARRLNRANSVVSYAIANLEAQLGLVLFDRDAAKRPVLTEAGKVVVAQARVIAGDVANLRAKAKGLLQGLEAEVNLVLDVMLPTARVVDALRERGVTVPRDVSVVGFDNWEIVAEQTRPPLTTIDMNLKELGRQAGLTLVRLLAGEPVKQSWLA